MQPFGAVAAQKRQPPRGEQRATGNPRQIVFQNKKMKEEIAMKTQQVPNSPYFIHYDDEGFFCVSKDKDGKEPIPESETQAFLAAVANGLLYIEQERKSRYQRIDEVKKVAFAKGETKGKEDKLGYSTFSRGLNNS